MRYVVYLIAMAYYTTKSSSLISIEDTAKILNVDVSFVKYLIKSEVLVAFDVCGDWYILPQSLASYIMGNETPSRMINDHPEHEPAYVLIHRVSDMKIFEFIYDPIESN
jgi:hypothetical protein